MSTDKFYEIDRNAVRKAQNRIIEALSVSNEKHFLATEYIIALGRFLTYRIESGDDNGQYEAIVDFLWMSFRIGINHKMLLLDLVNE